MMSKSRARSGVIAFLWLLAGMTVVLRATMQYTTFGGSLQQHGLNSARTQGASRGSRTAANAWNDISGPGYRPANNQVESRGAWMGVCIASALACIVQGLMYQSALVFVALTGLILGLAAKEGKFNGLGGQNQSQSNWGSTAGLNNSWQKQSGFGGR